MTTLFFVLFVFLRDTYRRRLFSVTVVRPNRKVPTNIMFAVTFYLYHRGKPRLPSNHRSNCFYNRERPFFKSVQTNVWNKSNFKGFKLQRIHTGIWYYTSRRYTRVGNGVLGTIRSSWLSLYFGYDGRHHGQCFRKRKRICKTQKTFVCTLSRSDWTIERSFRSLGNVKNSQWSSSNSTSRKSFTETDRFVKIERS